MQIFLAADHAGFELKNTLLEYLVHKGYEVEDLGPYELSKDDDYPRYAYKLTTKVLGSEDDDPRGILLCDSGQGMAIAANRVPGIRAGVIWEVDLARKSRQDNNSNVLSLPAQYLTTEEAIKITEAWLEEPFSGEERHKRRLEEIDHLYG
ncbi:MAG: RpiB/LacA/LacB family sugar-phosphate isomerase [Candidatus Saccharimonadales bacterium]